MISKHQKPYDPADSFAMSEARADYLSLHGVDPTDDALLAYIERRQREHTEAERHADLVQATREGAAVATASANAAVLTVAEAAEFLKCSERTVVRMINRGTLKASKATGKTLVRRVDLEKLLDR